MKDEEESQAEEEINTDIDEAKAEEEAGMASGESATEETLRSKAASWFTAHSELAQKNKD